MAQTTKLISSISYNTPDFLKGKLYDLVRLGILEYAYWIKHQAEEDETKDHFHIVVKPNKRLDTSALRNMFVELVKGEDLPRGVLPFRPTSRMSDWILYSAHDDLYLIQKGESRKYHYQHDDFLSTSLDLFDEDWRDCHRATDSKIPLIREMATLGKSWADVVALGVVPVNHLFQYKDIFFMFKDAADKTLRNGRKGHEDVSQDD